MVNVAPFLTLLFLSAQDEEFSKPHIETYKKVAPAVVSVSGGGQSGSGVIIDKSGIVLTSPTACGTSTETVKVRRKGHFECSARVLGRVHEKELVVLQLDGESPFPWIELGDSDAVQIGHVAYAFGDSFGSIVVDDQVQMSLGVVSGLYELRSAKKGAAYTGPVLEVSAAVNQNQDGGPVVGRNGKLLGLTTLNYDDSKFTGVAIPINVLKKDIDRILREAGGVAIASSQGRAWIGIEVEETSDGLVVEKVYARSPAEKGGVKKGDLLALINKRKAETSKKLGEFLALLKPGDSLPLRVVRNGKNVELTVTVARKPEY